MTKVEKIEKFLDSRYELSDYPTLQTQFEEWSATRPLEGKTVVDVTPLFKNTLLKYRSMLAAGAELVVGESSFISADKEVLAFCKNELGLRVATPADLDGADVILDCAASYINCAARVGYVELTGSGIGKYRESGLRCYAADSSRIKRLETELGTGESFFRAMAKLGYSDWKGKKLVVFGSGKVGRGIVHYADSFGADVTVISDPSMALKGHSIIDFRDRNAVDAAIMDAYCVVLATGVVHALEKTASLDAIMNTKAMFANMGAEDEYGDSIPMERTLCEKRTINFILDEPTHLRFIDATMTLHNYGAQWLLENPTATGTVLPSAELEQHFLDITASCGKIDVESVRS